MKVLTKYSSFLVFLLAVVIALGGCNLIGSKKNKGNNQKPTRQIPTNRILAEYASPGRSSRNPMLVQGFGLVYNLGDNGGVEVDSLHRRLVVEELKRAEVQNPSRLVDSKDTAIVHVKANIPPGTRKGDPIDVEISLPSNSECRSLQGGILSKTILTEMIGVDNDLKRGNTIAVVEGPLLLDPKIDKSNSNYEKRAVILGKAKCQIDRDFNFSLDSDDWTPSQKAKIAAEMEQRINKRLKIEGEQTGVAKARSQPSVGVEVKMHPNYREAPRRYLAVVMSIRCFESETQQAQRIEDLKRELLDSEKAQAAALQLEALPSRMGADALYEGMKNTNSHVRFCSAEALAYMRRPGVGQILAEFARDDPKKRPAAIAALASMGNDLEAVENLLLLMSAGEPELRYGAFWALRRRDPDHPAIRAWPMETYPYHYHVLPFDEPLVHATTSRRSEIVLFSQNIKLNAPFFGNAGKTIYVDVFSPEQVKIVRVNPGRINEERLRPNSLHNVLEAITELGGSYQDTLEFLTESSAEQQNGLQALTCRFVVDGISRDKERSYNSAIYADEDFDFKPPVEEEPKKKSAFSNLNPTTWR